MHENDALSIFNETLNTVKPAPLINNHIVIKDNVLIIQNSRFDLLSYKNIYVLGAGKASAYMAQALEREIGNFITGGLVVVNYGNTAPCTKIEIIEAAHPIPDENSLLAGRRILEMASWAKEDDLVFVLISGGGSALLEALPGNISLSDLQQLNKQLISCGANISEINTIRKHISLVKGGHLARKIFPATCLSLIISDVPGDNLQNIASGPTAADDTLYDAAMQIIKKYDLDSKINPSIIHYINSGMEGQVPETLQATDDIFNKVYNMIIGTNTMALHSAKEIAARYGYEVTLIEQDIQGEASVVAKKIAGKIIMLSASVKKQCLLFGGETTVTVQGKGKGGRNQELTLAVLIALKEFNRPFTFLSCATDGADGPTDASGAWIDNFSWEMVRQRGLDPEEYLNNNDAYHFFEKINRLVKTGLTGTNVMDMIIVLLK